MYQSIFACFVCIIAFASHCRATLGQEQQGQSVADLEYAQKIRPLLEQYCSDCHSPGQMEGIEFLAPATLADVAKSRGLFATVVEQMENRTMPPSNCAQLSEQEHKLVVNWFKAALDLKPKDTDRIAQYVVEVYEDKKGNLWFGTMSKGVARYDREELVYFSEKDGLPSNTVASITEDEDGNLWVGTHAGVARFDGKTFSRVGPEAGLPSPLPPSPMASSSVNRDRKGNLWASVGKAVYRYDGKRFNEFKLPIDEAKITSFAILRGDASMAMEDRAGNFWFATDGAGAFKFDGTSFTQFTVKDGLCSNNVNSIIEDQKGRIWFACMQSFQPRMTGDGGLCQLDGTTFKTFPEMDGLRKNDLYSIYETRSGDIWIGATGTGAYRFDGTSFTLLKETDKPFWTRHFGVQDIFESRNGTLWFGFSGGLFRFDGNSFFNVSKEGPWEGLSTAMADAVDSGDLDGAWFHKDTRAALSALSKGEYKKAKQILVALKLKNPLEQTIQESTLNEVGYGLIGKRRIDLAVDVLKLNTVLYPNAFNTFDSLGEAYLYQRNEDLAVENYQKSLELNPDNQTATEMISIVAAGKKYRDVLVAPNDWMEEVLVCPPGFAQTMSWTGMEHLRLPPSFREPNSDWFLSYLFAIELSEPTQLNEVLIGEQLLIYFRGLASGGRDKNGKEIDTNTFSIEPLRIGTDQPKGEFSFVLRWQEPFVNATPLKQRIRVKILTDKNKHGVLFVCGSPKLFDSEVWTELLKIRANFEAAPVKARQETGK